MEADPVPAAGAIVATGGGEASSSGVAMMEIEEVDPGVLDLCSRQLKDLSKVVLKEHLTEVDLTANRLTEMDPRILALPKLEKLSLRQNLVTDASGMQNMANAAGFKEVVFHDNHIKQLPSLAKFASIEVVDVGYNEVRSMAGAAEIPGEHLRELTLASNKIGKIESVGHLQHMKVLELGSNRIRVVENLDQLTGLEELWLGRNKIAAVGGMGCLTGLRRVSLQSNRLTSMAGLEACTSLEELYLSHNAIAKLEGLAPLASLKVLDVSSNKIERIEELEGMQELTDLWLNDNRIESFDALEAELKGSLTTLTTVYLHGNPAAKGDPEAYKSRLLSVLPNLEQLDWQVLKK